MPLLPGPPALSIGCGHCRRRFRSSANEIANNWGFLLPITALGEEVVFTREERERHIYAVGKTGSGKSKPNLRASENRSQTPFVMRSLLRF